MVTETPTEYVVSAFAAASSLPTRISHPSTGMRPSLGTLAPMRRAFAVKRYRGSDPFGSRARLAVAAATGVTLTYLYFPFDRRIALDSGSPGSLAFHPHPLLLPLVLRLKRLLTF